MILNLDTLDVSLKNTWTPLAGALEKLGCNIQIAGGRKGATVIHQDTGAIIGEVTREMIEDEEINYILSSRLGLTPINK